MSAIKSTKIIDYKITIDLKRDQQARSRLIDEVEKAFHAAVAKFIQEEIIKRLLQNNLICNKLLNQLMLELSEKNQETLARLLKQDGNVTYSDLIEFYNDMQDVLGKNNDKYSIFFCEATSKLGPIASTNIPKHLENLETIQLAGQKKHKTKLIKKSIFRKILEFIFSFLKTDNYYVEVTKSMAEDAFEQIGTRIASELIADKFTTQSSKTFEIFDASVTKNQTSKFGKLDEPSEQPNSRTANENPKSSQVQLADNFFNDSSNEQSLSQIIESEQHKVICEVAFNETKNFLVDLYKLYNTANDYTHNNQQPSMADLGLAPMDNKKFHKLLISLASTLGFEHSSDKSAIENLVLANEAELNLALLKFAQSKESLAVINKLINDEVARMLNSSNPKEFDNYLALLLPMRNMLSKLNSQEMKSNGIRFVLQEYNLEENIYNPDDNSWQNWAIGIAKNQIATAVKKYVNKSTIDAAQKLNSAKIISNNLRHSIQAKQNLVNNSKAAEINAKLRQAKPKKVKFKVANNIKNDFVNSVTDQLKLNWKSEVMPVLVDVANFAGQKFLNNIFDALTTKLTNLESSKANPKLIQKLKLKMSMFQEFYLNHNLTSPEGMHLANQAFLEALELLMQNESQLDAKTYADLSVIFSTVSAIQGCYSLTDLASKVYNDVYKTSLNPTPMGNASDSQDTLISKAVAIFKGNVATSIQNNHNLPKGYSKQRTKIVLNNVANDDNTQTWGECLWSAYNTSKSITSLAYSAIVGAKSDTIENTNKQIINRCNSFIKEQAFDAICNNASLIGAILEATDNPQMFCQQLGLGDHQALNELFRDIAQSLGYASLQNLAELEADIEKTKDELKQYSGYFMTWSSKHRQLQNQLNDLVARKNQLRTQFSSNILDTNKFAQLKAKINAAYQALATSCEKNNDAKNNSQYIAMLINMHDLIAKLESAQKVTTAIELYGPDLEELLGTNQEANGTIESLIKYAKQKALEQTPKLAEYGLLTMFQADLNRFNNISNGLAKDAGEQLKALPAETCQSDTISSVSAPKLA